VLSPAVVTPASSRSAAANPPPRPPDVRPPAAAPAVPRKAPLAPVKPSSSTTIAVFSNLKMLVVTGPQISDLDVLLSFSSEQLRILPPDGRAPLVTLPYARIERATYVRAPQPKWDPALAGPVAALDITGRDRHWLALQSKDAYAILRLDGEWQRVIEAFESIAARRVERPVPLQK
jgi:hypothetical protein